MSDIKRSFNMLKGELAHNGVSDRAKMLLNDIQLHIDKADYETSLVLESYNKLPVWKRLALSMKGSIGQEI